MSVGFLDLVRVTLSTTGTGSTLTIAAAVAGWLDFTGAGGVNGTTYRYAIIDGNNSEIGTATYNSGTNTLAGRTVTKSTNSNSPLNLTSAAILAVSIAAEGLVVGGTNYGTMAGQAASAVAITGGSISGTIAGTPSWTGLNTFTRGQSGALTAPSPAISLGSYFLSPLATISPVTHLDLFGGTYGFGVSNGQLNIGAGSGGNIAFFRGAATVDTVPALVIAGSGIGIGTVTPNSLLNINANAVASPGTLLSGNLIHLVGANSTPVQFLGDAFATAAAFTARRANGTAASPTGLVAGDVILNLAALGWNSLGAWSTGLSAAVQMFAAETWNGTAQGAYLTLVTTPTGSAGALERMRVQPSGGVSINTTTDPGAGNLNINGSITAFTATTFQPQLTMWNQTADANAGSFIVQKSRAASGAGSAVQVGDVLGTFAFRGNDSAGTVQNAAFITSLVTAVGSGFVTGNLFLSGSVLNFGGPTLQNFASPTTALYTSQVFGNALNTEEITNDNLALGASINYDSAIYHVFGGSSVTGARCGSLSFLGITAPTSASNTMRDYTGGAWGIIANGTGDNGTNTTPFGGGAGAKGAIIGGNIYSQIFGLSTPASNWLTVAGLEIDCFGTTNVSMAYNWALSLVSINAVRGAALDSALVVYSGAQSFWGPGVGFQNGITFAEVGGNGLTPISSTGSLIAGSVGTLSTIPVAYGCDFRNFTFANFAMQTTGAIYNNVASTQTGVGGGWGTAAPGTTPTPGVAGSADTFFSTGFFNSDATARTVPYGSTGLLLGNALQATEFVGNTQAGTGDPTPQGSTQAVLHSSHKANASGGSGSSVYGQTGGQIIVVNGGWGGTTGLTFTQTTTLVSAQKTYTLSAAPTNHHYVPGMPVVSSGSPGVLPSNTVIVSVSGNTITLNNAPTTPGACTLTFWSGQPVTTPFTAVPSVPNFVTSGYNPFTGTPGDTFAVNGEVNMYDNGYGVAEWLECVVQHFAIGGTTANVAQRITIGITSGSPTGMPGFTGATGTGAVGFIAAAASNTANNGVGFFCAGGTGPVFSWFAGTDKGNSFDMTLVRGTFSSPEIKRDIVPIGSVKAALMAVQPVRYRYHEGMCMDPRNERERLGFVATSHGNITGLHEAFTGHFDGMLIHEGQNVMKKSGLKGYWENDLFAILCRGVQEVWAETEVLLDRMNGLEARVSVLEGRPAVN